VKVTLLRKSHRITTSVLGLLCCAAALGACGGEREATTDMATASQDAAAARQMFQTTCRSCHALADAKAAGTFGPDLDLLAPDAERVRDQINDGGGGMPAGLLEGDDAELVARYVAAVAGQTGDGSTGAPPTRRDATQPTPAP
jgi:cytochrome c551